MVKQHYFRASNLENAKKNVRKYIRDQYFFLPPFEARIWEEGLRMVCTIKFSRNGSEI